MKSLDEIKLNLISSTCQVTIFDISGKVLDSCDTFLKTEKDKTLFSQFDFLKSLEEVFQELPEGEKIDFSTVEWEEQVKALFAISFEKLDSNRVLWIIQDKSGERQDMLNVQQERNNATINEEILEMQRKYLEVEKQLLDYKNEELLRVQKFKEQFFAEVSHEMRTPLNSISGLISLLKEQYGDADHKYFNILESTSSHLRSIINDVLDLSKIEAGRLKLNITPFNLEEELTNMITGFSVLANDKGLKLDFGIDNSFPTLLKGDSVRISQVIYNLLGNAVKYTEKGTVALKVSSIDYEKNFYQVSFSIEDTGKGMSEGQVIKILEPYAQVEGQNYHELDSTGLGMGIAYQLIDLMGGQLSIKSKPDQGTKVSFTLLLDRVLNGEEEESVQNEETNYELGELSLLVAEDDETNLLVLKAAIDQLGVKACYIDNVGDLRTELEKEKYDCIFSDINLTDGNAISLLADLNKDTYKNTATPIVFLSGDDQKVHANLEDVANWYFLMKPIELNELKRLMSDLTRPLETNLSNLRASTQGDIGLMKELLDTIIKTLPFELRRLERAVFDKDLKLAGKVLHKINPSISYIGNMELIEFRKTLHSDIGANIDISDRVEAFKRLISRGISGINQEKSKL